MRVRMITGSHNKVRLWRLISSLTMTDLRRLAKTVGVGEYRRMKRVELQHSVMTLWDGHGIEWLQKYVEEIAE